MKAGSGPARACPLKARPAIMAIGAHIPDGRPCPGKQPHAND